MERRDAFPNAPSNGASALRVNLPWLSRQIPGPGRAAELWFCWTWEGRFHNGRSHRRSTPPPLWKRVPVGSRCVLLQWVPSMNYRIDWLFSINLNQLFLELSISQALNAWPLRTPSLTRVPTDSPGPYESDPVPLNFGENFGLELGRTGCLI